jgi:LPXTG-site transpeptidase (sortase) family protein
MRDLPQSRGSRLLAWMERLFILAGTALLVWCALLVLDATWAQREARRSLESEARRSLEIALPVGRPPAAGEVKATVEPPLRAPVLARGAAIGDLSIPRIQLTAVVLNGSDSQTLRRGPGHLEQTALPGESGNVVIAGHRDSFFRPLRNIQMGDDIFLDTPYGRFHYHVTSIYVVNPHDLSVLEPTDNATLTLITCYPFWVFGNAPDRFIVRAARVVEPAAAMASFTVPVPLEPSPAPSAHVVGAARVITDAAVPADDEHLVRQTIERFRLTYNARLLAHGDVRANGPLAFLACHIAIVSDQATATCQAASHAPDNTPEVWMLTLQRAETGWAIKSVQS